VVILGLNAYRACGSIAHVQIQRSLAIADAGLRLRLLAGRWLGLALFTALVAQLTVTVLHLLGLAALAELIVGQGVDDLNVPAAHVEIGQGQALLVPVKAVATQPLDVQPDETHSTHHHSPERGLQLPAVVGAP